MTLLSVRPLPRELGVLLAPHDRQVHSEQDADEGGDQEDVNRVQPADDPLAGPFAPENQIGQVLADEGDRQQDPVHDPQPRAGEQVVGKRVAGESGSERQHQQRAADHPVELAGPPERAGEEDPTEVQDDRCDEHQGRPVMGLSDEQSAAGVEAGVEHRFVGGGHLLSVHGGVRAVVGDHILGGREQEREEDPGDDDHDQAVHRQLAPHEGEVAREDLLQRLGDPVSRSETPGNGLDASLHHHPGHLHRLSQVSGPMGSSKSRWAMR